MVACVCVCSFVTGPVHQNQIRFWRDVERYLTVQLTAQEQDTLVRSSGQQTATGGHSTRHIDTHVIWLSITWLDAHGLDVGVCSVFQAESISHRITQSLLRLAAQCKSMHTSY